MANNKIYAECVTEIFGGGSTAGNPPKACKNFTCEFDDDYDVLKFKWEDTDSDFWGGCRLVVKIGSAPENIKDGDFIVDSFELNKYKTTPLEVPITQSATYYATLFPFDTNGIANPLKVNAINLEVVNHVNPVSFAEDSWDTIIDTVKNGTPADFYHVGDTKPMETTDGKTYTMEVRRLSNNSMMLVAQELCEDTYTSDIRVCNASSLSARVSLKTSQDIYYSCNATYLDSSDIINQTQTLYDILPKNIQDAIVTQTTNPNWTTSLNLIGFNWSGNSGDSRKTGSEKLNMQIVGSGDISGASSNNRQCIVPSETNWYLDGAGGDMIVTITYDSSHLSHNSENNRMVISTPGIWSKPVYKDGEKGTITTLDDFTKVHKLIAFYI